ncbi:MAG: Co2+/Mg2+ efflux protein ApaG [Nitrosomonadales bacterium]|jgi:ApaG protein
MVDKKIKISSLTEFMPNYSSEKDNRYFFVYCITIQNQLEEKVQLLSRHWKIENSNGSIKEVKGLGVVGEQPIIAPGDSYTYTSATEIDSPVGSMHGTYTMETNSGMTFEAEIPKFDLIMPRNLH